MTYPKKLQPAPVLNGLRLEKLTVEQLRQVDELLSSLGEYGEVQLIVQHGELKYINKVESRKAWQDGEHDMS